LEQRAEYSRIFSRFDDSELIYLDETNINLHTSKVYGFSPRLKDALKVEIEIVVLMLAHLQQLQVME
jgi:hypothetical protein